MGRQATPHMVAERLGQLTTRLTGERLCMIYNYMHISLTIQDAAMLLRTELFKRSFSMQYVRNCKCNFEEHANEANASSVFSLRHLLFSCWITRCKLADAERDLINSYVFCIVMM